jgi:hypothetical protein
MTTMPDPISAASRPRSRWPRYSAIELLSALVLLIVFIPFLEEMRHGALIEVLLLTLVFVSAVFAVGTRRSTKLVAGILATLALVTKWLEHLLEPAFPPLALVCLGFVIIHLVRSTLEAQQVDARVLCAAIAAYLILGLFWTMAYVLVGRLSPDAFAFATGDEGGRAMNRFNAFYFSFVTLSTVGYGDISPVSKVARMLAVTEAMTGMLYVAVLIARLVSLYFAPSLPSPDLK